MLVGDIYIEALKLMYATGAEELYCEPVAGARTLEDARGDEEYADLLLSMPGALARALADVEAKDAVPVAVRLAWERDGLEFPRVTRRTPDTEELRLPEFIAALIPYFIAGDLYRREDPGMAAVMRNRWEAGLEEIINRRDAGVVPAVVEAVCGEDWGIYP